MIRVEGLRFGGFKRFKGLRVVASNGLRLRAGEVSWKRVDRVEGLRVG